MDKQKIRETVSKLKMAAGLIDRSTILLERELAQIPEPPPVPADPWKMFIQQIARHPEIPNNAKLVCVAMAIQETGRGTSKLFKELKNGHGMKWREELKGLALPEAIKVPSEQEPVEFCKFQTYALAVDGWLRFLKRWPYEGWEDHQDHPRQLVDHIQEEPAWSADPGYAKAVKGHFQEAKKLLEGYGWRLDESVDEEAPHPGVEMVHNSPNQSPRTTKITHIVIHNTAGEFDGAVSWLCNPEARASAHIVISRSGKTASLVPMVRKAWHAGNATRNNDSIGIELEAYRGTTGFTEAMEAKLLAWIRWIMDEFNIPPRNIGIHRWYRNTSCPGLIWPDDQDFRAWRRKHFGV